MSTVILINAYRKPHNTELVCNTLAQYHQWAIRGSLQGGDPQFEKQCHKQKVIEQSVTKVQLLKAVAYVAFQKGRVQVQKF